MSWHKFFSDWLELLLEFYGLTRLYRSQMWLTIFLCSGWPMNVSSRLELCILKIASLDFSMWVNLCHRRVDSNSASLKINFYFSVQVDPCYHRVDSSPVPNKKNTKIDSLSSWVSMTLLIIVYKNVYSINKHNSTHLSRFKLVKINRYKINNLLHL